MKIIKILPTAAAVFLVAAMVGLPGASRAGGTFQVSGGTQFYVNTSNFPNSFGSFNLSSGQYLEHETHFDNVELDPHGQSIHLRATAEAGPGTVGASTFTEWNNHAAGYSSTDFYKYDASATGRSQVNDWIVMGPAGSLTTSMNLTLTGAGLLASSYTTVPGTRATAVLSYSVYVNNAYAVLGSVTEQTINGGPVTLTGSVTSSGSFTTPVFTVPVNTPFSAIMTLSTGATVQGSLGDTFILDALGDYFHTLSLPTDGTTPILNLPDGYTLSSVDGQITGNRYVGSSASAAAPEPSSAALVLGGVLSAGGLLPLSGVLLRRQRSRRH